MEKYLHFNNYNFITMIIWIQYYSYRNRYKIITTNKDIFKLKKNKMGVIEFFIF